MNGFRHVVTLTWLDNANDAVVEAAVDALRALPDQIPEIRSYEVGQDAGLSPGNASIVIVADFDSSAGFETYRDHPAHRAVIDEHIRPILADRSAVQHARS